MRCKSCLQIFSQPSPKTKETSICSICRGIRTGLKRKEICEKTEKILLNRNSRKNSIKNSKKLTLSGKDIDHYFISCMHFLHKGR